MSNENGKVICLPTKQALDRKKCAEKLYLATVKLFFAEKNAEKMIFNAAKILLDENNTIHAVRINPSDSPAFAKALFTLAVHWLYSKDKSEAVRVFLEINGEQFAKFEEFAGFADCFGMINDKNVKETKRKVNALERIAKQLSKKSEVDLFESKITLRRIPRLEKLGAPSLLAVISYDILTIKRKVIKLEELIRDLNCICKSSESFAKKMHMRSLIKSSEKTKAGGEIFIQSLLNAGFALCRASNEKQKRESVQNCVAFLKNSFNQNLNLAESINAINRFLSEYYGN